MCSLVIRHIYTLDAVTGCDRSLSGIEAGISSDVLPSKQGDSIVLPPFQIQVQFFQLLFQRKTLWQGDSEDRTVGWYTAVTDLPQQLQRQNLLYNCWVSQARSGHEVEPSYCPKGQIKSRSSSARDTIAPNFSCCQKVDPRFWFLKHFSLHAQV